LTLPRADVTVDFGWIKRRTEIGDDEQGDSMTVALPSAWFSGACGARPVRRAGGAALAALMAALAMAASPSLAQNAAYPTRPVKLLVGFSAGGAPDLIGREIASGLSAMWGQPVIVENKTGAAATLAADTTAKAPPDGYTLFLASDSAMVVAPFIQDKMPYQPLTDFRPLGMVAGFSLVLVATPGFKVSSFADFVAAAKARPGAIDYASFGIGTSPHVAMERLQRDAGVKLNHVPYKGSPPAVQDLLGGQVQVMWGPLSTALPHIQAGTLVPLAAGSLERLALLPSLPTLPELGFPGFEAGNWFGLVAPAKLPDAVARKIEADLRKVAQSDGYRERLKAAGIEVRTGSAAELAKRVETEYARNKALFTVKPMSRD
jgi:tripartite-type tricarboxylate transporter receptor subunit TctC